MEKVAKLLILIFPILCVFDEWRPLSATFSEYGMLFIICFTYYLRLVDGRHVVPVAAKAMIFPLIMLVFFTFWSVGYHLLVSNQLQGVAAITDTSKLVVGVLFMFCVSGWIKSSDQLKAISNMILFVLTLLVIGAFVFYYMFQNLMVMRTPQFMLSFTGEGTFLGGTVYTNPNHYSRFVYFSLPLTFIFYQYARGIKKHFIAAVFIMSIITVLLTISRMATLMIGLILVYSFYAFRGRFLIFAIIFSISLATLLSTDITGLYQSRVEKLYDLDTQPRIWALELSKEAIAEHPFVGLGPGNFKQMTLDAGIVHEEEGKASHNNFLFIAVQFGLPAGAAFIYFLIRFLFKLRVSAVRGNTIHSAMAHGGVLTSLIFLFAGMSATIVGSDYIWYLLGIYMAFLPGPKNRANA